MDLVLPIVFALAVMGGLAVLAGWLADRKRYNFVLFAVLGLLLGIFAVIIAAAVPKKKLAHAEV